MARRVLRGLGLVQKHLPAVERAIFGEAEFDEAIWPRTKKLLTYALTTEGFGDYIRDRSFECYETDGKHKDILERIDEIPPDELTKAVFLTRIKGSTTSMTYTIWNKEEIWQTLMPPFNVIENRIIQLKHDVYSESIECWIVVQETENYIKQFMQRGLFRPALERVINAQS